MAFRLLPRHHAGIYQHVLNMPIRLLSGLVGIKVGFWRFPRLMRCHPFGSHGLDVVPDEIGEHGIKFWKYGRWNGKHIEHKFYDSNNDDDS